MFLIVNQEATREVFNLTQAMSVTEVDTTQFADTTQIFPYKIVVINPSGEESIIYQTDEKFQCSTVMAAIVGALEEGKKTFTIENPTGGISYNAVRRRALETYDGTNYIFVIKQVREMTGWGLKEAKAFCDEYVKDPQLEAKKQQQTIQQQQQKQQQEQDTRKAYEQFQWEMEQKRSIMDPLNVAPPHSRPDRAIDAFAEWYEDKKRRGLLP